MSDTVEQVLKSYLDQIGDSPRRSKFEMKVGDFIQLANQIRAAVFEERYAVKSAIDELDRIIFSNVTMHCPSKCSSACAYFLGCKIRSTREKLEEIKSKLNFIYNQSKEN